MTAAAEQDQAATECADAGGVPDCADPAAFHTALAHLYRAEMTRMTVWRQRLDTTTHWAIVLTTGLTSFVLGSTEAPHYAVLLALAFNTVFMVVEGRRYQHLHHSKWRLGLMERNYFARLLVPAAPVEPTWRCQLSADLARPHITLSLSMGVRLRLRRNYLMLAYLTTAVWITKVFIHPESPSGWDELYRRLAVGDLIPSWIVGATALTFVLFTTTATLLTPSEEALERWSTHEHSRRVQSSAAAAGPSA